MALPRPPLNPAQPIPNNPFFSPQTNYIQGATGPLIVGTGLSINLTTGTISATGGGGGGAGTVTSIATGAGLTGGPITSSGTISLTTSTVTPGTYNYSTITVDAQGRLTAASSGAAPLTNVIGTPPISVTGTTVKTISIASASTTTPGAVQLFNGTNSTSTALALTAAQGKSLQDQISALLFASNLVLAGTFDATAGVMLTVTNDGTTAGFLVGSNLPTPSAATDNHFVIVTTGGTYDPPGEPLVALTLTSGDWLLSSTTEWSLLDVGATFAYATTTTAGIVCLSTNALAQVGTDTTTALTPAAAASAYIPNATVTGKGAILTGTGAGAPAALPASVTDGCALIACAACACGLTWGAAGGIAATPTAAGVVLGCTTVSNTALGCSALSSLGAGTLNVALGNCAGCAITTGSQNVAIGPNAAVASATGSCQLAIGFSATDNWLIGDSSKNIRPGAGIIDCAASTGTAGQILSSTATGIAWRSGCVQQTASCTAAVTLSTEVTTRKLNNGDSLTVYNSNAAVPPVAITLTATAFSNYQTYPTQATATVFTLPPSGSVTLILADSATNTWYIESYDTPAQVGTVAFKAYNPAGVVPLLAALIGSTGFTAVQMPVSGIIINPQGYYSDITTRFQPLAAGNYHVVGRVGTVVTTTNRTGIVKNGSEIVAQNTNINNNASTEVSTVVYLNGSTDYVQLGTDWSPTGSFNNAAGANEFSASLVSQTNTRVVGIDAAASMTVTAGNLPNSNVIIEVIPGVNGVTVAEEFDPQNWIDTATGKFTPTIPGYYQVNAVVTSNNNNFNTWGGVFKNGVKVGEAINPSGGGGGYNSVTYSSVILMNGLTDYLRLGAASQGSVTGFPSTSVPLTRLAVSLVGANQAQPIPPMTWISAGTVQSVGLASVISGTLTPGTAPTITASTQNNVRYRQIGPKEWEVQGILFFTNGTAGSGDYVLTLPAGLQFDITSPYQLPYTAAPDSTIGWYAYGLPGAWVEFSQNAANTYYQSVIMPIDATRYRIVPAGPTGDNFWSSAWYQLGAYSGYRKWSFTFFTP